MGYNPSTKSGHNMFDIASLLQKAIRRGDAERAGYAAYELLGGYDAMLWKRLLVVSAEDCWGVLTEEIMNLYLKHMKANAGKRGYDKDPTYVSEAITILCKAKKSRDACYFACNFILSYNQGTGCDLDYDRMREMKQALRQGGQFNIMDRDDFDDLDIYGYWIFKAIEDCNMENAGYALKMLMNMSNEYLWDALMYASEQFTGNALNAEISALKTADEYVNRKKKPEEKDPIFISKAVMNMMYYVCDKFDSVLSEPSIRIDGAINWSGRESVSISECILPGAIIPDYVYDVHTLKGKRMGRTDWEMNLVENDALRPFQPAFFEEGSWELRYDYKHDHKLCTQKEYEMSLEYRKTHEANPAKKFLGQN